MSSLHSDSGRFFIPEDLVYKMDWDEQDNTDHQLVILQKADTLASQNRIKEALELFSVAIKYGPVRPEQLGTLVDCVLRNFKVVYGSDADKTNIQSKRDSGIEDLGDKFCCPGCHRFLSEPMTVDCGHTYCKRCLQRELFSKCKLCNNDIDTRCGSAQQHRTNVVLSGLLEKWFPDETKVSKVVLEIEDLTRRRRYEEALFLSNKMIESDPGEVLGRVCRVEAYAGLRQYEPALRELEELCLKLPSCPEVYFQKGRILQQMGCTNRSLQVFLQCLALDGDFAPAKKKIEKIVYDLVSPDCQKVKEGLQDMAQGSAPRLHSKTLMADGQAKAPPLTHHNYKEKCDAASFLESEEQSGLGQAALLGTPGRLCGSGPEEGLKRVSSAPQLGRQDKGGAPLKRKLSVCEAETSALHRGGSKHLKQGDVEDSGDCAPAPCREAPAGLVEAGDFECPLCMRLFYEPVTTPCGHTFCRSCLERCLDHMTQCPLCKDSLKEYLAIRRYSITEVLDRLIKTYLPEVHLERCKMHMEETEEFSDPTKNVPVFVCTMAYPTVPCPLHVFEPRYRLMIRRCMETGTKRFGMCISDSQKGFADYGCMLQIRSMHVFPDGRSVVDTVGWKRFQVLSRDMRDGYNIADIHFLEDEKVDSEQGLVELQELHDQVYKQARSWFQNLKSRFRGQILQHFGPMPKGETDIQATPNGPAWCWWLLAVLPVDPRYQLSVLSMLSLKERLAKIQQILTYLQSVHNE